MPEQQQADGGIEAKLEEIRSELAELREAFDSFTNGGFPLRQEVATPELLGVLASFISLMGWRDSVINMNQSELQVRLQAAMTMGTEIMRMYDTYKRQTERVNLDQLIR